MATLIFLIACLIAVFTIDIHQKRQRFLNEGK